MPSKAAEIVLGCSELVEKIVTHLTRWEAVAVARISRFYLHQSGQQAILRLQLLTTSKVVSAAASECIKRNSCRARMVLTSSRNNMLVEINPLNGKVVQAKPAAPPGSDLAKRDYQWITGIAFSPRDHDLYVCNYEVNGVERYHGNTFAYKGVFVSSKTLTSPEGLAISDNFCFVGGATHGVIAVVNPAGRILRFIRMGTTEKFRPVPWGLTVLPLEGSDIVLASIDNEYQAASYKDAPDKKTGGIYCCAVSHKALKGEEMHYLTFKSGLGLSRPSGLFLEPLESFGKEKKCYLYITSMHAAVLRLKVKVRLNQAGKAMSFDIDEPKMKYGPDSIKLGTKQWDVRTVGNAVFVTNHCAFGRRAACMQKYSREGQLLATIKSDHFSEPNMLAVDF